MSANAATMDAHRGGRDRKEEIALRQIAERLAIKFPGTPAEVIRWVIRAEYATFADSRIRDFIPVLVERSVRSELAGLLSPGWSGDGRAIARWNASADRLDLHNFAVDQGAAAVRRCGRAHLASGRVCLLPARHRGGCDFRLPAELPALRDADADQRSAEHERDDR